MMADAAVRARVDHLAFHNYSGSTSPGTAYSGKDYWLTESAQWCSTCDQNGAPSQGEWASLGTRTTSSLRLANGLPAVLVWEAYDSFYYHHNSYSTWGLLAYNTVDRRLHAAKALLRQRAADRLHPPRGEARLREHERRGPHGAGLL